MIEKIVVPKAAWDLCMALLALQEPPDSRAVSDHFVALACVEDQNADPGVMEVIERTLVEVTAKLESGEYLKNQPQVVVTRD